MTAPRVGDTFHVDLDGTAFAGHYIEVEPPHRLLLSWDRHGIGRASMTPAFIEITLTPTGDGTDVRVRFSGLIAKETAYYSELWERHLDQIATALAAPQAPGP